MTDTAPSPADSIEPWACVAYGKDLADRMGVSQVCFFPSTPCISADECTDRMTGERQRLYRHMQERAAVDPLWAEIAEPFGVPDRLLNGTDDSGPAAPSEAQPGA